MVKEKPVGEITASVSGEGSGRCCGHGKTDFRQVTVQSSNGFERQVWCCAACKEKVIGHALSEALRLDVALVIDIPL